MTRQELAQVYNTIAKTYAAVAAINAYTGATQVRMAAMELADTQSAAAQNSPAEPAPTRIMLDQATGRFRPSTAVLEPNPAGGGLRPIA